MLILRKHTNIKTETGRYTYRLAGSPTDRQLDNKPIYSTSGSTQLNIVKLKQYFGTLVLL